MTYLEADLARERLEAVAEAERIERERNALLERIAVALERIADKAEGRDGGP